jgi:hypothetical protein
LLDWIFKGKQRCQQTVKWPCWFHDLDHSLIDSLQPVLWVASYRF